ncbi:hypothetical protein OsI_34710 [Oryza sativa Indica Group]|uniref:Uncharacterized protein n=1 Tax=Oryza sativa subsp. indica TaxID=39946 RepID=B8BIC0_ORYSI|nr:hypothetical protein OsI_34710 [Oryza sativa Indica Group]
MDSPTPMLLEPSEPRARRRRRGHGAGLRRVRLVDLVHHPRGGGGRRSRRRVTRLWGLDSTRRRRANVAAGEAVAARILRAYLDTKGDVPVPLTAKPPLQMLEQ